MAVLLFALSVAFLLGASPAAVAEDAFDGAQLREIALRGIWAADHAEYGYWSWSDDGAVCLRLGAPDSDCADRGRWAIEENVLCYELTWWGESVGERKSCFTVKALADGRYETVFHGGAMDSRMFAFEVME